MKHLVLFTAALLLWGGLLAQPVADTLAVAAPTVARPVPPPPPPPPTTHREVYKVVEHMPRFPGCEDKGSEEEKKSCAQAELLKFVYKNLQYPAEAKAKGIEGIVVVTFVVEPDGSVSDAKVTRDIGGGCGEEAVRIVNLMNELGMRWTMRSRGRLVPVQFNLPVKFKL